MENTKISSYNEVETLAKNLDAQSEKMKKLLDNVTRLYETIGKSGTWAGVSAEVVSKDVENLSGNFDKLVTAIQGCSQFMTESIKTYRAVDEEINVNN